MILRSTEASPEEAARQAARGLARLFALLNALRCQLSLEKCVIMGSNASPLQQLSNWLALQGLHLPKAIAARDLGIVPNTLSIILCWQELALECLN